MAITMSPARMMRQDCVTVAGSWIVGTRFTAMSWSFFGRPSVEE
jgi:hypothetical protein